MKSKISDRPMFKKPVDETDVENVGIMQGFMDEDPEEPEYEKYMQEEEEDEDESDMARVMDRRPNSPEILMNNLRGDMRSVDARVEELADLVGYNAASETPTEVLALLQPVLAQGIGSMPAEQALGQPMPAPAPMPAPQGGMPPAPMGMPPAPMPAPQGPMMEEPPMEAPVAMAMGGYVQRFSDGSDEDGVTPSTVTSSFAPGTFSRQMIERARNNILNRMNQPLSPIPDLESEVERRSPLYEKLLGVDPKQSQAQILFELGNRAFNYAANVDDQGNRLRGSQIARLAGATRTLPGAIGGITAQMEQQKRGVRSAALQATEKDIQNIREQNAKQLVSKANLEKEILKTAGTGTLSQLMGKGDWQWNVVNQPGLMDAWSSRKTSPEQDSLIESAITTLSTPRTETRKDRITNLDYTVVVPGILPPFVKNAMKKRGFTLEGGSTSIPSVSPNGAVPEDLSYLDNVDIGTKINTEEFNQPTSATGKPQKRYTPTKDALRVNPKMQNFYTDKEPTLYNMSEGTGLAPAISSKIFEMPILGGLAGNERLYRMRSNLKTTALNISKGVAENPRYAEGERKYIQGTLDVLPKLVDTPEAYQERLFAFDSYLQQLQEEALKTSFDKNMPADTVQNARAKAQDIYSVRAKLGVPLRIDDRNDPRFKTLPLGTKVLFGNRVIEVFE